MHFCLYLCLPRSEAKTSLQARRKAAKYLSAEGFASETRFGGVCDYFGVGGRWSGRLELMRLKHKSPTKFRKFWRQFDNIDSAKQALKLFEQTFPDYDKTTRRPAR